MTDCSLIGCFAHTHQYGRLCCLFLFRLCGICQKFREASYTDYEEIRTMAQNIIDVQEKEIARMEKIVKGQQESQPE